MSTHFFGARGFARATPRLPQPLTPESLNGVMRERAYWDATHPRFPTYQRLVKRGFEILYPGPETAVLRAPSARRDDTGMMIDTPPLPPERVAHLVEQTNRDMESAEGGFDEKPGPGGDGAVHVEAHTRDGGKVEVADYWRATPGQGAGHGGAPNDGGGKTGEDVLRGQSGEDTLPEPNTPREPPKDAYVAPDPDKLVRDWSGKWRGEEEEKRQCVDLVKAAIPKIGNTSAWQESEKILGPNDPPLAPGTAIATFTDGKYINKSGESHAGIFLEYGARNGKDGMWILDQHEKQPAQRTFLSFDDPGRLRTYQAERYSVIRRNP